MGLLVILGFSALVSFCCHISEAYPQLDSKAILHYESPIKDKDSGEEIDDTMPGGGADEMPDHSKEVKGNLKKLKLVKRADYGKTINELMADSSHDTRYAPSEASYKHFAKLAADEYTMEDVKNYEKRSAIPVDRTWPKAIVPYEFSIGVQSDSKLRPSIFSAMKEWEQKTCIKFEPFTTAVAQKTGHDQRVLFKNDGRGCWSRIGKQGESWEKPQPLNLQRGGGCDTHRVVTHEIGHVLGFAHEQARTDRDNFLRVDMNNVQPGEEVQYDKEKEGSYGTPYDYLSIMHYGPDSFGKVVGGQKLITMTPIDSCYANLIGRAKHLSYYDHKEVNTKYGCTSGCESMACGTDCYATKSGENQQCHCVCLDHSNNPCMGGSCFGGDVYNNCAQMFRDNPNQTCGQFKDQCCETCKGVKMDARCPQGDRISSCQNLIASFGKSDFCNMSDSRNKCCQSCL